MKGERISYFLDFFKVKKGMNLYDKYPMNSQAKFKSNWLELFSHKPEVFLLGRISLYEISSFKRHMFIYQHNYMIVIIIPAKRKQYEARSYLCDINYQYVHVYNVSDPGKFIKLKTTSKKTSIIPVGTVYEKYPCELLRLSNPYLKNFSRFLETQGTKILIKSVERNIISRFNLSKLYLVIEKSNYNELYEEKVPIMVISNKKMIKKSNRRVYNRIYFIFFIILSISLVFLSKNVECISKFRKSSSRYRISSFKSKKLHRSTKFFFVCCKRTAKKMEKDNEDLAKNYNKINEKEPLTFCQKLIWIRRVITGNERRLPPEAIEEEKRVEEKSEEGKEEVEKTKEKNKKESENKQKDEKEGEEKKEKTDNEEEKKAEEKPEEEANEGGEKEENPDNEEEKTAGENHKEEENEGEEEDENPDNEEEKTAEEKPGEEGNDGGEKEENQEG